MDRAGDDWRLIQATNGLLAASPELSAAGRIWRWQSVALMALPAAAAFAALQGYAAHVLAVLSLPFLAALALRFYAISLMRRGKGEPRAGLADTGHVSVGDEALPVYTLIVPLFREANVAGQLIASLERLRYPRERFDVLLVTEACDTETRAALIRAGVPWYMRILTVPDGQPRTKPRALNYALTFARGDFVVVYDAEDEPEPDQLLRALALFRARRTEPLGCVQARLNIYNPDQSWLTRQFTIEYSALFDCILPALERLGLPVPLGGTSNHFPRAALERTRGWDPHNVTEDADLGIRLMRQGWRIAVLQSTTWEEAPPTYHAWFPQRTRWLKGWLQTVLVHTRAPGRLYSALGAWRATGFLLLMGGLIVSALLHPWFLLLLAGGWWLEWFAWPATVPEWLLLSVAGFHFVAGYAAAMTLGAMAVRARGLDKLAWQVAWMFLYWLAISAAAHRALWQLFRFPHLWEKTPHSANRRDRHPGDAGQFTTNAKS